MGIVQDTSANNAAADYDCSKCSVVQQDSNLQATVTTGGEDHLVQSTGGGDPQPDSGQSGGKSLL